MLGRAFLTTSALLQMVGPFVADFNHTHVRNPNWPPHAKFHNGQTMSMGLGLGLATLYFTYRTASSLALLPSPANPATALQAKKDDYLTAAIFGSLYWITGISAILYPGTLAVDPEFGGAEKGFPQLYLFLPLLVLSWVGAWVEGGLGPVKGKIS